MFDKLLIANRGEIAVRVAATARRLGIATVAVFSDADRDALHVECCDEAFHIGPPPAADSYLDGRRIVEAARRAGAGAIHPGYGFLSENAAFARACEDAGIVFVGPPAAAIEAMGSKARAKEAMAAAGVPLIPGYHGADQDDATLAAESRRIGYPQLLKASAGGGGKGMRRVEAEAGFAAALASARREASAAFGDASMLIERYLERPRHVEVQVFGDRQRNYLHLNERDCSLQRRHQKVIEEAPAPGIDAGLRARLGAAAVECARAIAYQGAGTVEFLLAAGGDFYFMEMNTRLQVEHPVTEMITGLDLVEWQLRVAAGEPLPLAQSAVACRGHAVEARLYAESPAADFMPAAGRIAVLDQPYTDAGLRIDSGVREGDEIGVYYDPMIAKLIVHARDRDAAFARLRRGLDDFRVLGVDTNIGFLARLAASPDLLAGDFDTGYIERHRAALLEPPAAGVELAPVLAAVALLPALADAAPGDSPWALRDHWRLNLPAGARQRLAFDGEWLEIETVAVAGGWRVTLGERHYRVEARRVDAHRFRALVDGRRLRFSYWRDGETLALALAGTVFDFRLPRPADAAEGGGRESENPRAPMSGRVVALPVGVGDTVAPGATLAVIEAMKMEHAVQSQVSARVAELRVAVGDQVDEGDELLHLEVEAQT